MDPIKLMSVLWKAPKPAKKQAHHKKQAPGVTWQHVWMKTKELYFFRRKVYFTLTVGCLRAIRKPVEHRQPRRANDTSIATSK